MESDQKTGLPIVSLYGAHKKPTIEDLKDVDLVVFDIQDVGARFYTYSSTLHYVMEACAENKKPLVIFDRYKPEWTLRGWARFREGFCVFCGIESDSGGPWMYDGGVSAK
jgi:hypothetical protein